VPIDRTAALLERAYRLALVMESCRRPADLEARDVATRKFEDFAVAKELVAILDEARISLLAKAGATTGSQE
jgi:hypothetical protein